MSLIVHLVQDGTENWDTPLAACSGKPYNAPTSDLVEFCEACRRLPQRTTLAERPAGEAQAGEGAHELD